MTENRNILQELDSRFLHVLYNSQDRRLEALFWHVSKLAILFCFNSLCGGNFSLNADLSKWTANADCFRSFEEFGANDFVLIISELEPAVGELLLSDKGWYAERKFL